MRREFNDYPDHPFRIDPGNGESIGRLAVAVQRRLHPFISRTMRDPHATEDVLQETLLAMVERLGGLRRPQSFWPWIYRVARGKIQDHFRQQRHRTAMKENAPREIECRFLTVYRQPGPLEQMIGAEDARALSNALREMDGRQRQVVHLRCFEQLPYAQIADRAQMSPAQARINFHRAKTLLRKRLCVLSA